jgi:hypothetical protein
MSDLNWEIIPEEFKNTWLIPSFVLGKLREMASGPYMDKDIISSTIDSIPLELWRNKEFQREAVILVMKLHYENKIPLFVLEDDNIFEALKLNQSFFELTWEKIYYPMCKKEINKRNSIVYENDYELNPFVDKILKLINSEDWLFSNKLMVAQFYEFLSNKNKENEELITLAIHKGVSIFSEIEEPQQLISISVFNDIEKLTNIWNYINKNNISLQYHFIKKVINSFSSKDNCIKFLSLIEENNVMCLWNGLSKQFKKDKMVMLAFVEKDPEIYIKLSKKWRSDNDIITKCIKAGGTRYIENPYILEDKDLIGFMIKEHNYLLTKPSCPLEWRKNIDYIKQFKLEINYLNLSELDWLEITRNDINICEDLMQSNPNCYKIFSKEIRSELSLVKKYIKSDKYCDINSIPREVWYDRDFCLFIADHYSQHIMQIPNYFWHEKKFMKSYCALLDDMKATQTNYLIKFMPSEIKTYFNTFDIKNDYSKFLSLHIISQELNETKAKQVKKYKI